MIIIFLFQLDDNDSNRSVQFSQHVSLIPLFEMNKNSIYDALTFRKSTFYDLVIYNKQDLIRDKRIGSKYNKHTYTFFSFCIRKFQGFCVFTYKILHTGMLNIKFIANCELLLDILLNRNATCWCVVIWGSRVCDYVLFTW